MTLSLVCPGVDCVCDPRYGAKSQFKVRLNLSLKATPSDCNCVKLLRKLEALEL